MKYVKPNGTEIEINDGEQFEKLAADSGWKPAKEAVKESPKPAPKKKAPVKKAK